MSQMTETAFSFSNIESHTSGQTLPQGQHEIRGWVWPKAGEHLVDVRVRAGARMFAAIHGYPRADLAKHFQTGRPFALAEFRVVVELAPGENVLTFEALAIDGSWRAFESLTLTAQPAGFPAKVGQPTGALHWHDYGRALQFILRQQARHPEARLEDLIAEFVGTLPQPRDLLQPPQPFRGHLDEPAFVAPCRFGRLPLFGYLLHESAGIRHVYATVDLQVLQAVAHDKVSPAVAKRYPERAQASHCGLAGYIDAPSQLPQPVPLRVYAELEDGSLHLVIALRTRTSSVEEDKSPYPAQSQVNFYVAHWRLLAALKRQGFDVVEDALFEKEIARLARDFEQQAPTTAPHVPDLKATQAGLSTQLPGSVLLATHNLNFEGAPLFLVDLAAALCRAGVKVSVVSPSSGPLQARFEQLGATVELVDVSVVFAATARQPALAAISELAPLFRSVDLAVANTFTTFWGVHAAALNNVATLLYVHESTTPAAFYSERVHPEVVALVEEAFGLAARVSFTTAATRSYHVSYGRPDRHRLCPGWVDVAGIDDWLTCNPRTALRDRFGVSADEFLVTNVGTVCDRKGQHIFVRAVDLLWRRYPELAARSKFVLLGGGQTPFDMLLSELIAQTGRPNIVVEPAASDYLAYYAAADVFVCSTYEESTPRVVLEAMTCGTAVLASAVHGIPELAAPGEEAILIPAGDTFACCEEMARLLNSADLRHKLGDNARRRIRSRHDMRTVLNDHLALIAEAADSIGGKG
jgi:glycosyltransferase involved in cell wall biosynthesis